MNNTPPLLETFTYREYRGTIYYKPYSSEVSVVITHKRSEEAVNIHFTSPSVSRAYPTFKQLIDQYVMQYTIEDVSEDYDEPSLFYRGYVAIVYRIANSTDLHVDIPRLDRYAHSVARCTIPCRLWN